MFRTEFVVAVVQDIIRVYLGAFQLRRSLVAFGLDLPVMSVHDWDQTHFSWQTQNLSLSLPKSDWDWPKKIKKNQKIRPWLPLPSAVPP